MSPQYKNHSPKKIVKHSVLQGKVSTRKQEHITPPITVPKEKPLRELIEPQPLLNSGNKINRLHIVVTCVNYSDFLIISLSENIKIIDPKHIIVVTDSQDTLTKQICNTFGVNCVITNRFYEDGAVFNKGKGINDGINSIVDPDWILITDADIVFPTDLLDILNKKRINTNKLYAATRYLCHSYAKYQKYKNNDISLTELDGIHHCPPVGYFQLFSYNHPNLTDKNSIYPENSIDASWSDMLFADKFPQKECLQNIKLLHLGEDSKNWKGRKTERFINDTIFNDFIIKQEAYPFITSIREQYNNDKLAVITSFFNPANYSNIKSNYIEFKDFINKSGVDLFTIELVFDDQEFFTEESEFNIHIRGDSKNIMWQKERLLNILIDKIPVEYNNIAWIDCDVILDDYDWVNKVNTKLKFYKMIQLFETGKFYNELGQINRISDGIIKHLHNLKLNKIIDFHTVHGGTPGLAWAIRRECIQKTKFVDDMIIGGGDAIMMLASVGCFDDQFVYKKMNSEMLSQTLKWSHKFYKEIQNSVFYIPGNAYHLYHGTNLKRNYNNRIDYLNNNSYTPNYDIVLDNNKLWAWSSDKPNLHNIVKKYFFDRDEDDNLKSIKNLNNYFDGIFCINLERRSDKWDIMQKRFNRNNIKVTRIGAFDGDWNIVKNEWQNIYNHLNDKFKSQMTNPSAYGLLENQYAYGTLCSHISVITFAKQHGLKKILVFEDDVVFHKHFNEQLTNILKLKNWKLLYLGASQYRWENITLKQGYYNANHTLGGFAYCLDSSVYDEVLNLAFLYEKSFDNCLGNFNGHDIQSRYPNDCYALYPNIVIADVGDSDLREKRNLDEHAKKMRWDLNLYDFS